MKHKPLLIILLFGLLAASACDPIGRGIVAHRVPEPQLAKTVHPTRNARWTTALGPAAAGEFRSLAIADFDGDGLPDLAAGGGIDRRGVRIWLANGDGTWSSIEGPKYYAMPSGLAAADFDKDGRPDLVVCGKGEVPGVRVFLNTANLVWKELPPVTTTSNYLVVGTADINHDGYPDIIAAREKSVDPGGIAVWLNREGKGWTSDVGPVAADTYNDIAIADLNNDGHLDIAATRWGTPGGIDIWYGNGLGAWSKAKEEPAAQLNYQGLAIGDFNADGFPDILATTYRGELGVVLFLNDGQGGWWTTPVPIAGPGSFWSVQAADINGDGLLDIAATSFDGRGVRVWLQLPHNKRPQQPIGFVPQFIEQSFQLPHAGTYYWVQTADFNGDKKPDLAAVTLDQGVKAWFQTDEKGILQPSPNARGVPASDKFPPPYDQIKETVEDPKENLVYITVQRDDGLTYPEYRIGVGDELRIEIYPGRVADPVIMAKTVEASGELLIPLVSPKPIRIVDKDGNGLSPSQLRDVIQTGLGDTFMAPSVAVIVERHNARKASVLGEVRMKANEGQTGPGWYVLRGKTRVLEFIADHGGFTEKADLSRVEVRNRDGQKRVVDLFKAIFQSKLSQDVVLDDGDVITIPSTAMSDRKVYVLGEVSKPGVYGLQDNVTLLEAVQLANSFLPSANRNQVIVIRGDKSAPQLLEINMLEMLKTGNLSKNILLQDGDVVFVPSNWIANLREFYAWFLPGWYAATRSGLTGTTGTTP